MRFHRCTPSGVQSLRRGGTGAGGVDRSHLKMCSIISVNFRENLIVFQTLICQHKVWNGMVFIQREYGKKVVW
jgi:hypothetical protein